MTFTQLTARLKNFLRGWLLIMSLKECLVECATLCIKSEVILLKVWGIHEAEIPSWQKNILKVAMPILKKFIITVLKIDKEHADVDFKKSDEFFGEIDKILSKNQFILGTEEPTYIDYSFAAIAAIRALPDQYGGPNLTPESRLKLSDFTLETQEDFKKFRNTPSGTFVMKMYAEHR